MSKLTKMLKGDSPMEHQKREMQQPKQGTDGLTNLPNRTSTVTCNNFSPGRRNDELGELDKLGKLDKAGLQEYLTRRTELQRDELDRSALPGENPQKDPDKLDQDRSKHRRTPANLTNQTSTGT